MSQVWSIKLTQLSVALLSFCFLFEFPCVSIMTDWLQLSTNKSHSYVFKIHTYEKETQTGWLVVYLCSKCLTRGQVCPLNGEARPEELRTTTWKSGYTPFVIRLTKWLRMGGVCAPFTAAKLTRDKFNHVTDANITQILWFQRPNIMNKVINIVGTSSSRPLSSLPLVPGSKSGWLKNERTYFSGSHVTGKEVTHFRCSFRSMRKTDL